MQSPINVRNVALCVKFTFFVIIKKEKIIKFFLLLLFYFFCVLSIIVNVIVRLHNLGRYHLHNLHFFPLII